MKALKQIGYWIYRIAFDVVTIWGLFYLWQWQGMDGAGNALMFLAWAFSLLNILIGFIADRSDFGEFSGSLFSKVYGTITGIIEAAAFAWFGLFLTATVYVVGVLMLVGAKNREPKAALKGIGDFKAFTAINIKNGDEYVVIGEAADATNSVIDRPVTIYQRNGMTFVRCSREFAEKFVKVEKVEAES